MTNLPTDYQHVPAPAKKKSLRWLWIGCGALLLGIIVALGFGITWLSKLWDFGPVAKRLSADVVAAKSAGVPLKAKDLAPLPPVALEDNAAPLLLAAGEEIGKLPKRVTDEPYKLAADGSADPALVQNDLMAAQTALSLGERAAAKPRCDYKRQWDLGPELLFPDLVQVKKIVRLFAARAMLRARKGDHVGAVKDLEKIMRLSEHAASDPSMIALLVAMACDSICVATAEKCMSLATDPHDLILYEEFLQTHRPPQDVRRVLRGEAFASVTMIRNLKAFSKAESDEGKQLPIDPTTLQRSGMPRDVPTRALMARTLEMWTNILTRTENEEDGANTLSVTSSIAEQYANRPGASNLLVKIIVPIYGQCAKAYRKDEVQWRLAAALARALRFKVENGRFPKNLAEIHMAAADPFGKNLLYKTDGKSVRIYSVGPDGKDDGGKQRYQVKPGKGETWDIALSYPPSMTRDAAKILLKR